MSEDSLTGRLLIASPRLRDGNFDRTIVLVIEHDGDGALGVVLNRAGEVPVREVLPAWADRAAPPDVVFEGGPVAEGVAIALGRVATPVPAPTGWAPVLGSVGVVDLSAEPETSEGVEAVRIFSGYAGWGPGQLEGELEVGAWYVVEARPEDALGPAPEQLWSRVLRRQGGSLARLALYPLDPSQN